MKLFIILITSLVLTACSNLLFKAANVPVLSYDGKIIENVEYGVLARQQLDIYIPSNLSDEALPVIVFFHGGRWTFGDKSQYKFVGDRLSQLGYVVVMPNTRLYPDVKFPVFVEDAAKAVSWVHKNIGQYQGNKSLFLSGHSSGAHMAALLISDPSYLQANDMKPSDITAFAGMAGPYDFEPKSEDLKDIFGPPENFPKMAVGNFIDGSEPPMLLLYSNEDETVHIQNLKKLQSAINSEGGEVASIIYPKGGHASTVSALSWANPDDLPVVDDIDTFFRKWLNKSK